MENQLLKALKPGPKTNKELREQLSLGADPKLDRTLQKLRKDGKITVIDKRWALSIVGTCPTCEGRGWVNNPTKSKK